MIYDDLGETDDYNDDNIDVDNDDGGDMMNMVVFLLNHHSPMYCAH